MVETGTLALLFLFILVGTTAILTIYLTIELSGPSDTEQMDQAVSDNSINCPGCGAVNDSSFDRCKSCTSRLT